VRLWVVVALGACSPSSSDVTGPFTGELRTYHVDMIRLPRDSAEAAALAADLDGDGMPENQLGTATAVLATTNDLSTHGADMIATCLLDSGVAIHADDFVSDDSVAVSYHGFQGAYTKHVGGRFTNGSFVSNRTRDTKVPGLAGLHLPVFVNASPMSLYLYGMEMELQPDGNGGYDGIMRGGMYMPTPGGAVSSGLQEMFETEPERHLVFLRTIDTNRDDQLGYQEIQDSIIALLVRPDIALVTPPFGTGMIPDAIAEPRPGDAPDSMSVAFAFHITPNVPPCARESPTNPCRDRVRGGDETDVDCGGSCQTCWAGKYCSVASDCQSGACDEGRCRMHTCSDGVKNGFESDIDCGGSCGPCATGRGCAADTDCASNNCDNGVASLGVCL
jgi:hypothetical protein